VSTSFVDHFLRTEENYGRCQCGVESLNSSIPSRYKSEHCAYVHSVATQLNPRGATTVSHKYSLTVAIHATVVVAVPSTVHCPSNYKIYYLRFNLKV
jgi:hypothetical protein